MVDAADPSPAAAWVPEDVRRLAVHPFVELDIPPGIRRIEGDGFVLILDRFPTAQVVDPVGVGPDDVLRAVDEVRALARREGKSVLAWWITPEAAALAGPLERLGLRNEATTGWERVEHAMALVRPPASTPDHGVTVKEAETLQELTGAMAVALDAFDVPQEARASYQADVSRAFAELHTPGNPSRRFVAFLDGRIVGTATAGIGAAGINLFGGSVLPAARGRGVYRELTLARWRLAVALGRPALTVQAGRMAKPIVERLGFVRVAEIRVFVDRLA